MALAYILLPRPLPTTRSTPVHTRTRTISHSVTSQPFFLDNHRYQPSKSENQPVLRMLMFGKPGAGKGTLSAKLVKKYDILSLSTGDLLRGHITERTEVGRQAEEIVKTGELLPDDIVLKVVTSKLDLLRNKHWILDGFPRTVSQARLLDDHLKKENAPLSLIVNLDVPDSVILSRISDRWVHLPSGRVYNMNYNRPKVDGLDDATGEKLVRRPDDNPETFARRLSKFYSTTSPLLSYYATPRNVVTIKATTSDAIWPQLEAVVKGSFPALKERRDDQKRRHRFGGALVTDDKKREHQKVGHGRF